MLYVLYKCIITILKLFSPIAPFVSEKIYQNLKGEFRLKEESIHLFDWPTENTKEIDKKLENNMEVVGNIIQSGLAAREKMQLGLRWPIKDMTLVINDKEVIMAVEKLGLCVTVGGRTKLKFRYLITNSPK